MNDFLLKLFNFSQILYSTIRKPLSNLSDGDKSPVQRDISLGKAKISSNMLNTTGIKSMQNIISKIRDEFPDLKYSPILSRLVQFFLWYVPQEIASKMIIILINEDNNQGIEDPKVNDSKQQIKFFSTNISHFKSLIKNSITFIVKDRIDKGRAKKFIGENIEDMFVSTIPAMVYII